MSTQEKSCDNPTCNQTFLPYRQTQRWCSGRCLEVVRARTWLHPCAEPTCNAHVTRNASWCPLHKPGRQYSAPEWVGRAVVLYQDGRMSIAMVAAEVEMSEGAVFKQLRRQGVLRSRSEAMQVRLDRDDPLSFVHRWQKREAAKALCKCGCGETVSGRYYMRDGRMRVVEWVPGHHRRRKYGPRTPTRALSPWIPQLERVLRERVHWRPSWSFTDLAHAAGVDPWSILYPHRPTPAVVGAVAHVLKLDVSTVLVWAGYPSPQPLAIAIVSYLGNGGTVEELQAQTGLSRKRILSYIYHSDLQPSRQTLELFAQVLRLWEEVDEWAFDAHISRRGPASETEREQKRKNSTGLRVTTWISLPQKRLKAVMDAGVSFAEAAKIFPASASTIQKQAHFFGYRSPGDGQHRGTAKMYLETEKEQKAERLNASHKVAVAKRLAAIEAIIEEYGPAIHFVDRRALAEQLRAEGLKIGNGALGEILKAAKQRHPRAS
jgi:transposase